MKSPLFLMSLTLISANAWASGQLNCKINENINPPLQARSTSYDLASPLTGTDLSTRIDLKSETLGLDFGIVTFLSTDTSPGQQVILISAYDSSGTEVAADGHGSAELFYDTKVGGLAVICKID